MSDTEILRIAMFLLSFVVAVTIHEFAHALTADLLGDDTPRRQGRLTLSPLDHLSLWGTACLLVTAAFGSGFGWGRPVQIMPSRFRKPRTGDAIVSIAGPLSNLLLAGLFAAIIRTGYMHLPMSSPYIDLINVAFQLNVTLFVFNLVPIPPLDGSHILCDILPPTMADRYRNFMASFGWYVFIAFIWFGMQLIEPAIEHIQALLLTASILR